MSIASASLHLPAPQGIVAFGEIGLAGELRKVRDLPQRLNEAARLGFRVALVPGDRSGVSPTRTGPKEWTVDGMKVIDVHDVASALRLVGLSPRVQGSNGESGL